MAEASLRQTPEGLVVGSEGWFVLNVGEARAMRHEIGGLTASFEPSDAKFSQLGINIRILEPGQPASLYHSEQAQEDFLVLAGECVAILDGEERRLRQWDLVHCPPGTEHVFVGAGDGPCAILMVGARDPSKAVSYPVNQAAARYRASVPEPTDSPPQAYAAAGWKREFEPVAMPWPPSPDTTG